MNGGATEVHRHIPMCFAEVELEDSLKLAAELNIYAYDAYLIRCALKYNAPLLSLDESLLRVAQAKGAKVVEVD